MAISVTYNNITIRGITYNIDNVYDPFVCYESNSGATSSEGAGSAKSLEKGTTYYLYAKATGDTVTHPYAVSTINSGVTGWYKENVFPYAKYTVSYNANGGSGAPSSQTKTYGTNLTLSSTKPTRSGYTFKGWALSKTDANNGTWYYQAGGSCGKNENLTLYAVWEIVSYNITIDCNGGSGVSSRTYTVETASFTLGTPTRTGYTFLGWTGSNGSTAQKTITISKGNTGNKSYKANWSENKLTVNYYSNYATYATYQGNAKSVSASTNVLVHSQDFLYDNAVSSGLADIQNLSYLYLARIGYTPTGKWGTSTTGGTLIDQSTTYSTGQALAQAFGKSLASGNASVNIYPQWQINTYTIKYNANKGYGSMNSQSVQWNGDFVLSNNVFKREGYKFIGWNVRRDSDDTWYVIGQGWKTENEIVTNGYEKKLYENQAELTFNNSWVSGNEYMISEYTLYAIWEIAGVVYIDSGTSFEPYLAYIDNGTNWDLYLMYVDDGTNWNIIS